MLCLACGGGHQSIAFALLDANVTVFDLSEDQLNRDREAATRFNVDVKIVQGDALDSDQSEPTKIARSLALRAINHAAALRSLRRCQEYIPRPTAKLRTFAVRDLCSITELISVLIRAPGLLEIQRDGVHI